MLTRLEIRSFALIEHAVFCPKEGLNVISGETGAGKSLLIDAIGLIFGQKASKNLIRNDSDSAYVEAVFDCDDTVMKRLIPLMEEYGIPVDEGNIIISRTFREEGKSIARINGTSVVLSRLKDISRELIDIHGQNDNSRIFDTSVHIEMLDRFGGTKILSLKEDYRSKLKEYKDLTASYKELSEITRDSSSADYLKFAVEQIEGASLRPGEDEELTVRKKELAESFRNRSLINDSEDLLSGQDPAGLTVSGKISEALRIIKKLSEKDESFTEYYKRLESLSFDLDSFTSDYLKKTGEYSYNEDEERRVTDRLGKIYELESKYGKTIDDVIGFGEKAKAELLKISNASVEIVRIKKQLASVKNDLLQLAEDLSELRKRQAEVLSSMITEELKELEMPSSSFYVKFDTRPKDRYFNINGIDDVTFMFSANPGQPPMDLSSVASGGEASRIMLAIKKILSSSDMMPTLIFDEIDTGVSGKASLSIARKLKAIAREHQVLLVSHTAQLAAASDSNFLIRKQTDGERTFTEIIPLNDDERINEVARLLSGKEDKESTELASKMIGELRT